MCKNRWSRIRVLRLAVSTTLLVCTEMTAKGQPIVQDIDSVEWMAADSSLIVRGTVIAEQINEEPQGYVWHKVAFKVDETLKGEHHPTLRFVVQTNTIDTEIGRWRDDRRPLIAFLDDSRRVVAQWRSKNWARFRLAPRTGYRKGSFLELDRKGKPEAYTLDFRALTRPEEIVQATRNAIQAPTSKEKLCSYWFMIPGDSWKRLTVPLDSRLEAQARKWVGSADKEVRREGAAALVFFRSDDNAELLKGLLKDPATWDLQIRDAGDVERRERVYAVREEAYSVLVAWGYDVGRPITRVPIPPH